MQIFSKITFLKRLILVGSLTCGLLFLASRYPYETGVINPALSNITFAKYKSEIIWDSKDSFLSNAISALFSDSVEAEGGPYAEDIPVLLYHGIVEENDRFNLTADKFKEHMSALRDAGYETVTLEDLYEFMNGRKRLPEKSFVLTFDDGRKDSYYGVEPLLRAFGWNAVMFIATEQSLREDNFGPNSYYLNEGESKEMINSGHWEIGSHAMQGSGGYVPIDKNLSKGNFLSNRAWIPVFGRLETYGEYADRVSRELEGSKQTLESTLGINIGSFAYPFGDYGQRSRNAEERAIDIIADSIKKNYKMAFRQIWPNDSEFTSNYKGVQENYLSRIESDPLWSGEELLSFVENVRTKDMPFEDTFSENKGWKTTWGSELIDKGVFTVEANSSTTGAFSFLDGTGPWRDYSFEINLNWDKGSHVTLIARFVDRENYVSCTFGEERIKIEENVDGDKHELAGGEKIIIRRENVRSLGISVNGSSIDCFENSRLVGRARLSSRASKQGGIGIEIWDENTNNASVSLNSLKTEGL